MTPPRLGATIIGMFTEPLNVRHKGIRGAPPDPEPPRVDLDAARDDGPRAGHHEAADTCSRELDGVLLRLVRSDLPDWQPLALPVIEGAVQLTVDLRPGGWRRTASSTGDASPVATHANGISLTSLDRPDPTWVRGQFEALTLILRREALDAFADDMNVPRWANPVFAPATMDSVIGGMACTLAGALAEPVEDSALYFRPLLRAVIGRLLSAHLRDAACRQRSHGSLAPWQERKAKAMLTMHMAEDISILEVARECRLSRSHFCKAFKQSTGQSPYAWLTHYRISTAQSLLRSTRQPLSDIALACGFGDQSHLTRMFSRVVGTTPGSWRRSFAG